MPYLLGVGGGPAATPTVIKAFVGSAGGDSGDSFGCGACAVLQAALPRTAAPTVADPATSAALREIISKEARGSLPDAHPQPLICIPSTTIGGITRTRDELVARLFTYLTRIARQGH
jgi:hypothetical protein